MIHTSFHIELPFWKHDTLWAKGFGGHLFGKKAYEVELLNSNYLIGFLFDLTFRGEDHAGLEFCVALFGWQLLFQIYDGRHWDYKNDRWEEPQSEKLTRDFAETVVNRARSDPEFRQLLPCEAYDLLLEGRAGAARTLLKDYVKSMERDC